MPTSSSSEYQLTLRPKKPMALSPALSSLLGETTLSRPQTVKKIWAYVKERDLQDPADKRQIRCDEALRAVFKQDRVHMFTMNKILNQNLYAVDEITTAPKQEVESEGESS
jgi:upstream activation factor subunit UAF30